MKLALVSDIHGNIDALDAVIEDITRRGIERVLNLGDCLSGPFDAKATADRLIELGWPTVRGNHDRQLWDRPRAEMGSWESWVIDDLTPEHLAWVQGFPMTWHEEDLMMCHATPDRDDENWLDHRGPQERLVARDLAGVTHRLGTVTASVVACGHTHTPRVVRLPGGPMIVNPGAVGCPAYLDTRTDPPFAHQTGSPDARYAILEMRDTGWVADLIHVPYDTTRMIALARAKGAESWACALSTGWVA